MNRWLVAGCCCALLVGLQDAALPVGASLLMNVSAVHMCMHVCSRRVSRHVERPVCAYAHFFKRPFVCVFVLVCPAVTLGNKAGNGRGVQPEQVIKKNPCKMALLWPPLGKQGRKCAERNESLVAAAEDKDRAVYDFRGLTS